MSWIAPVSLKDEKVALVPLSQDHHDDLVEASADGDLSALWYTFVPGDEGMKAEIERRVSLQEQGSMIPFAVVDKSSGKAVGMTTYMSLDHDNKRVEIGSTWYRKSFQRTGLNTRCKRLLLEHAFETLDCIAVEFRTHFFNRQSRTAIERLGAKQDGILRNHMRMPDGTLRDTCVFSILCSEWPSVKTHLTFQISKY